MLVHQNANVEIELFSIPMTFRYTNVIRSQNIRSRGTCLLNSPPKPRDWYIIRILKTLAKLKK